MSKRTVDFGPFTDDVYNGQMTVNQAREELNRLTNPEPAERQYDTILVIAKNSAQAQFLWRSVRDKYPKEARVKYVSRNEYMLDGLNASKMLIVLVGEYWLNPAFESSSIQWFKQRGADVVEEKG